MEKCSFSLEAMVRGYHVYRSVWEAAIGEELMCVREVGNRTDPYAVAVVKPQSGELTVGHLPRKISSLCSTFIKRGGTISCIVTSTKRYSYDLPQGGLEIPCRLKFTGNDKELSKTQKLAHNFLNMACSSNFEQNKLAEQKDNDKKPQEDGAVLIVDDAIPATKRRKIDIHCNVIIPTNEDLEAIIMGCKLSDVHINYAQELIKKTVPFIEWPCFHTADYQECSNQ